MMEKKYAKATIAILAVFAVGLVGFFLASAEFPDGLEKIMGDNGVSEGEPLYTAPLGYGSDYFTALIMGIIGFALVLILTFGYLRLVNHRKKSESKHQ